MIQAIVVLSDSDLSRMAGLAIIVAACMAILWGIDVASTLGQKPKSPDGVTSCPFCRGMHKPGECRRDKPDADLPPDD